MKEKKYPTGVESHGGFLRYSRACDMEKYGALTWGDVDIKNRTINVRGNLTSKGYFTVPKTDSGIRKIYLIDSAWEAIYDQMELTRMRSERESRSSSGSMVNGKLKSLTSCLTHNSNKKDSNYHYSVLSLSQTWKTALTVAGIRGRKAYQSRHTYACWSLAAGATPDFIANQMGHTNE
ncbi:tyrosine-type recombinase/integrase [Rosenbergiella metrosideri]|uniref:tyrosine-type recombinase/integrase n=1 Tax=Rosenbergiella metrosideri TaxID=2921185 RepID=UPI001F4F5C7F|nr:tyrosine-type recombinase/integrase [Rosenbergiella metrosideri]